MMKNIYFGLLCFLLVIIPGSFTANAQIRNHYLGEWNFRCPDASDGFDTGIIRITNDSVYTEYPGLRYTYSSNWIKLTNDTLCFNVGMEGQSLACKIKFDNENFLSGYLVTNCSSFLIILIKEGGKSGQAEHLMPEYVKHTIPHAAELLNPGHKHHNIKTKV